MRSRLSLLALIAMLTAVGCSEESPTSDRQLAHEALISEHDLPPGSSVRESPIAGAPCGPLPYMDKGATAESPMFAVRSSSVQQVVGVFRSPAAAEAAQADLDSPARRKCILDTLQRYSTALVTALPVADLGLGDESKLMSFEIELKGFATSHLDVATVVDGRGVTEILFLTEEADLARHLLLDIAAAAGKPLATLPE
jgi:hypothetical protein